MKDTNLVRSADKEIQLDVETKQQSKSDKSENKTIEENRLKLALSLRKF